MWRVVGVGLLSLPVLLGAQAPVRDTAPAADASVPRGTAKIRGRIVDAQSGRPLRGVIVSAYVTDRTYEGAVTDGAGQYEISGVAAGRFRLSARSDGYLTLNYGQTRPNQSEKPVVVIEGQALDNIDFQLPRGGTIAGALRDQNGDPLTGLQVRALNPSYADGRKSLILMGNIAQTDDRGEYRIYGLPPGAFYVAALGYASPATLESPGASVIPTYFPGTLRFAEAQRVNVRLGDVVTNIDLTLVQARMGSVSVTAVDPEGRPLATPTLGVRQLGAGVALPFAISAATPGGIFRLNGLTPGDYELRIRGTSPAPERTPLIGIGTVTIVNGEAVTGMTLTATKLSTGTGRIVVDPAAAKSLGPLTLEAVDLSDSLPYQPRAAGGTPPIRVQPDLTFTVNTPPGRVGLRFFTLPRGWYFKSVRLNGKDVTDDGIDFPVGGSLTGIEVELTNRPSELAGTVRGPAGEAIDDCTVVIFARDPERRRGQTRYFATARPDASRRFIVNGLPAGEYLGIALDWADPEASADPEFLAPLAKDATPFTLNDGEPKVLELRLVR